MQSAAPNAKPDTRQATPKHGSLQNNPSTPNWSYLLLAARIGMGASIAALYNQRSVVPSIKSALPMICKASLGAQT